jgi:hypothetical protein
LIVWNATHKHFIEKARKENYPVYIMRYEDLIAKPIETVTGAFKFILGKDSLEGTEMEYRINQMLGKEDRG